MTARKLGPGGCTGQRSSTQGLHLSDEAPPVTTPSDDTDASGSALAAVNAVIGLPSKSSEGHKHDSPPVTPPPESRAMSQNVLEAFELASPGSSMKGNSSFRVQSPSNAYAHESNSASYQVSDSASISHGQIGVAPFLASPGKRSGVAARMGVARRRKSSRGKLSGQDSFNINAEGVHDVIHDKHASRLSSPPQAPKTMNHVRSVDGSHGKRDCNSLGPLEVRLSQSGRVQNSQKRQRSTRDERELSSTSRQVGKARPSSGGRHVHSEQRSSGIPGGYESNSDLSIQPRRECSQSYGASVRSFLADVDNAPLPVRPRNEEGCREDCRDDALTRSLKTRSTYAQLRSANAILDGSNAPPPADADVALRSLTSLRSSGASRRFLDELGYILQGLDATNSLNLRRSSAVELVQNLMQPVKGAQGPASASGQAGRGSDAFHDQLEATGAHIQVWEALRRGGAGQAVDEVLDCALLLVLDNFASADELGASLMASQADDITSALYALWASLLARAQPTALSLKSACQPMLTGLESSFENLPKDTKGILRTLTWANMETETVVHPDFHCPYATFPFLLSLVTARLARLHSTDSDTCAQRMVQERDFPAGRSLANVLLEIVGCINRELATTLLHKDSALNEYNRQACSLGFSFRLAKELAEVFESLTEGLGGLAGCNAQSRPMPLLLLQCTHKPTVAETLQTLLGICRMLGSTDLSPIEMELRAWPEALCGWLKVAITLTQGCSEWCAEFRSSTQLMCALVAVIADMTHLVKIGDGVTASNPHPLRSSAVFSKSLSTDVLCLCIAFLTNLVEQDSLAAQMLASLRVGCRYHVQATPTTQERAIVCLFNLAVELEHAAAKRSDSCFATHPGATAPQNEPDKDCCEDIDEGSTFEIISGSMALILGLSARNVWTNVTTLAEECRVEVSDIIQTITTSLDRLQSEHVIGKPLASRAIGNANMLSTSTGDSAERDAIHQLSQYLRMKCSESGT